MNGLLILLSVPLGVGGGLLLAGQAAPDCGGALYEAKLEHTMADGALTHLIVGAVSESTCVRAERMERHLLTAHDPVVVQVRTPDWERVRLLDPMDEPVWAIDGPVLEIRIVARV